MREAGPRELQDNKQLVSSVLRMFPDTFAIQPVHWRTSQNPSSIYSHDSNILASLPTPSSLQLSESNSYLGEVAADAALPASVGVRCGE